MLRLTTVFCIAALMVLSAVSSSRAEDENPDQPVSDQDLPNPQPSVNSGRRGGEMYGGRGGEGEGMYGGRSGMGEGMYGGEGGYGMGRSRGRQFGPEREARNRLLKAQQLLAKAEGEKAKQEAITEMREALGAYFDADLDRRQSELDAIRKRVAEMEFKLQKRVDGREKIIALRLQVILNDADGLGWSGDAQRSPRGMGMGMGMEAPGGLIVAPETRPKDARR